MIFDIPRLALPCLMDPKDLRIFFTLNTYQATFLCDFCDTNVGTQNYDRTDAGCCPKDGQIGILKYFVM